MVPSFLSHIIAAVSLALPAMIISETTLPFLGLGLRPPAISWGVMLQDAQKPADAGPGALAALRRGARDRRDPGIQLPGRRAARRGRSIWLNRSSPFATCTRTSFRMKVWCARSMMGFGCQKRSCHLDDGTLQVALRIENTHATKTSAGDQDDD